MSWTAPRTWVDGETLTTVILNQHLRDDLLALLTVPVAKMHLSANQSVTNTGADVVVTLNTSDIDTDTMVDTGNNKIVIKTAGKYNIGGYMAYVSDTTGFRATRIRHTRSAVNTIIAEKRGAPNAAGNQSARCAGTIYDCQVNDELRLIAAHTGSAALNVVGGSAMAAHLWAFRCGT